MPYIGKQPANVPVTADDIPNDSITAAKIVDAAITIDDIGPNAVGNSEMADDAIGLNELSATGTTNSSTFLRGDNSWAVPPATDISGKLNLSGGTMTGAIDFGDNVKAKFGASDDLQIYHDGNHSRIYDQGTGNLTLMSNGASVKIQKDATEVLAAFNNDGSVQLYHNHSEKLATTSTGIDVTGSVTADGLTVDGASNLGTVSIYDSGTNATVAAASGHDLELRGRGGQAVNLFSNGTKTATFANNGDISFYEDTGGTPKFFWDASAESLGIGTSSQSAKLEVSGGLLAPAEVRINSNGGIWTIGDEIGRYSFYTTDSSGIGARELASIRGISKNGGTTASGQIGIYTSPYNGTSSEVARFTDAGLTFNGDTAAANALDDYETGTWTPTTGTGWASLTLDCVGKYTKIGNMVHVVAFINVNGSGIGSGDITMGGLPFTSSGNSDYRPAISVFAYKLYSNVNNYISGLINNQSTTIYIREGGRTDDGADMGNHFDGGSAIYFQATYTTG